MCDDTCLKEAAEGDDDDEEEGTFATPSVARLTTGESAAPASSYKTTPSPSFM